MPSKKTSVLACGLAVLGLMACGRASKEEIVSKARDIGKRAELERVLGRPDELTKLGPVETWRYKASNGEVVFLIVGHDGTLQAAGSPANPKDRPPRRLTSRAPVGTTSV